ncbi:MAG TPA: preprotein translocase subunit SecE [Segeticoccus sp.]|uniref:preprotein translocase subunit SecE n=1 Tax=Segeticoccus sp. TaxID=2706531 RepID=UPI002D8104E5|nr:preprotein translocase subunit SecE [Segeticoccus sp.]HET8599742.1 preprotein translocase subunit SecE [Segeticoccus sp.]
MTDTSTAGRRGSGRSGPPTQEKRGVFGAIALFVSQIIDELRKVVRPTREELTTYTIVVIVFVAAIMAYVFGLDYAFTRLVLWVFGGATA